MDIEGQQNATALVKTVTAQPLCGASSVFLAPSFRKRVFRPGSMIEVGAWSGT
jgi:hypothetical protein